MDYSRAGSGGDWRESLAGQVDDLVRLFGAGVFRDKWNKFKTDRDTERERLRKWEQERQKHLLKVLGAPDWQDADSDPPSAGWGWGADRVVLPDGKSRYISCWMPPELIGTKRPKLPGLLPLSHIGEPDYRSLELEEKYVVLALIHDTFGSHVERIICEDVRWWVKDKVPDTDRECLLRFLEEVREDLGKQAKPADVEAENETNPEGAGVGDGGEEPTQDDIEVEVEPGAALATGGQCGEDEGEPILDRLDRIEAAVTERNESVKVGMRDEESPGSLGRKMQPTGKSDEALPRTKKKVEKAIRYYVVDRQKQYDRLKEAVRVDNEVAAKVAIKLARTTFGRNALARNIFSDGPEPSKSLVSGTSMWLQIKEDLKLGREEMGTSCPGNCVGFDIAEEQAAQSVGDQTFDDVVRQETLARIDATKGLPATVKEELASKLALGDYGDEEVATILDTHDSQDRRA